MASQRRAGRFTGDVARLLVLAKGMRAPALLDDESRLERARARAQARCAPLPVGRFVGRQALEQLDVPRRRCPPPAGAVVVGD